MLSKKIILNKIEKHLYMVRPLISYGLLLVILLVILLVLPELSKSILQVWIIGTVFWVIFCFLKSL